MDNLSQMQFEANEASEVCALHKAVKKFIRQCTNNLKYCPKLRKQHKFHHEKDSLFGRNGLNAFFVLHTFVFGWQWPSNRCANQTEKPLCHRWFGSNCDIEPPHHGWWERKLRGHHLAYIHRRFDQRPHFRHLLPDDHDGYEIRPNYVRTKGRRMLPFFIASFFDALHAQLITTTSVWVINSREKFLFYIGLLRGKKIHHEKHPTPHTRCCSRTQLESCFWPNQ